MAMTDLPIFRAIREKMMFHEARQRVLAENVSNAETPGYKANELVTPDFFRMAATAGGGAIAPVAPRITVAGHLPGTGISTQSAFKQERVAGYEITPDGNGVVLEEQMMKVTANQLDYQMAASLYQRSLGILKTAVGRR